MAHIERTILKLHRSLQVDPHHRYRSWGHCYRYFRQRRHLRAQRDLDGPALQLGFYLASWGMYRGSSFLLWKDYRIHRYAVQALLKPRFDHLAQVNFDSPRSTEAAIEPIVDLVDDLRSTYRDNAGTVNGRRRKVEVTDTLATKILLATIGCTPAYDWYFIEGLRSRRIGYSEFNAAHFRKLCEFYRDHAAEFKAVQRQIHEGGMRYPVMRLVDMYFWEVGRRKAAKEEDS
jgi:hypothetical protein